VIHNAGNVSMMKKLTSLIRLPENTGNDPEDILESALDQIFPDTLRTLHGEPGTDITYISEKFGNITLGLASPEDRNERYLFAHHLWNAAILLAEYISHGKESNPQVEAKKWDVENQIVLEVGAGSWKELQRQSSRLTT